MLERIIAGIVIGVVSYFVLHFKFKEGSSAQGIVHGFIALIVIAFVGSSFMFGVIFGVMAIGEIVIGYWFTNKVFGEQQN